MRQLLATVITFVTLLAGGGGVLGWYSSRHYLPQKQMDDARLAGQECFLFLGDSRMVAAFNGDALHQELRRAGADRCLAQLAIGATDVSGMYLTAREYLSRAHPSRAAIIGKVGDSVLGSAPLRPEEMIGNNTIHLIWSRSDDVYLEVPGFPARSIDAFDAGLRFLLARSTPLGRYQSLVVIKVQRLGAWVTGETSAPQNKFGALGDMVSLEDALRSRGQSSIAAAMQGSDDERYGRWFGSLTDLLLQRGIVPIVVELPMRAAYRTTVMTTPQATAYQAWLSDQLAKRGGALLDLSALPGISDASFADELHLGEAGAAQVSSAIGRYLGTRFARSAP